ncbi:MAG: hypothetical protein K9W43_07680 [Candidatus Thorarchaeota archaeon]|nr:hypothetical protein [Candidatus Thorarchaeota archaeon]
MIFVDTGAFYAYHVSTSRDHNQMIESMDTIRSGRFGVMITTNYVLDELLTLLLTRGIAYHDRIAIGTHIRNAESIHKIWITPEIEVLA